MTKAELVEKMAKECVGAYESFRVALVNIVKETHHTQKVLADHLGTSPGYLCEVMAGRKRFKLENQEKVAAFFELKYVDFLSYGESLLRGLKSFPWISLLDGFPKNSAARASFIYRRAGEQFGLHGFAFFNPAAMEVSREKDVEEYMNGKIEEAELFDRAKLLMAKLKSQLG